MRRARPAESNDDDAPETEGGPDAGCPPEDANLGGLDAVVGVHLRLAQAKMHRTYMELLTPLDVTQREAGVLWLIGENPCASQVHIAALLDMDRASMMQVVDKLEGRDLVERRRSTVDRRRQELKLTAAGISLLGKAKTLIATHEAKLKARIGEHDLETFVAVLKRIRE